MGTSSSRSRAWYAGSCDAGVALSGQPWVAHQSISAVPLAVPQVVVLCGVHGEVVFGRSLRICFAGPLQIFAIVCFESWICGEGLLTDRMAAGFPRKATAIMLKQPVHQLRRFHQIRQLGGGCWHAVVNDAVPPPAKSERTCFHIPKYFQLEKAHGQRLYRLA
jgi:hypothetical protein